jgi:anaerobic nitric oxide reductase transcription regulator
MIKQQTIDRVLRQIALDLSTSMPGDVQFQRLVSAIGTQLPCDAVTLFQLQDGALVPMACHGLAPELLGRHFVPAEHPRLQAILAQREPLRFPADSPLPDPFDGLLALDHEREKPVHACIGCSLHIDGELVGALTFDALDKNAFAPLSDSSVASFAALAAASLRNVALLRALEQSSERQQAISRDLIREARRREGDLVGKSKRMQALRDDIALVAATDLAVLITGETGTGKELVARMVHAQSARANQVLVQINCAALPESVAESELFGHAKGSFTGAVAERLGKFELANGGTLFLDEIGELPLSLQAKLLRALQQGEIQRVGSDHAIRIDVRVIAATNRDLEKEVESGRFRADLFHRLYVFPIRVPALRDHREDLAVLAGHFLEAACARLGVGQIDLHPQTLLALQRYDWPGNVRELEHLLLRASLRTGHKDKQRVVLCAADLGLPEAGYPALAPCPEASPEPPPVSLREAVDAFQRRLIERALAACGGNWAQTARRLHVDRANLQRLAQRLGILSSQNDAVASK